MLSEKTIRLQSKDLYVDQRQSPSKLEARADYFTYKIQTVEFWESAPTPRAKQGEKIEEDQGEEGKSWSGSA